MDLKTDPNDRCLERLAQWIRQMDLADQVFIAGATLVFEDIRLRRANLPIHFDEANLREGTPATAYRHAVDLSNVYAMQPTCPGSDGVDEHWRILSMAHEIAERIAKYHPEVLGAEGDC